MSNGRPAYLQWASIGLVAIGGLFGAGSREGVSLAIPKLGEVPIAIAVVNIVGAFLLGYLYEAVTRIDSAKPTGKNLKLLLGTGFCGGFTTYSSLATDTAVLFRDGYIWQGVVYVVGTLIVGACATWAGIAVASSVNARMTPPAGGGMTS
ncbi:MULTISPECIES: fluoride efflux transporter FluC [unclassified Rhodococcus (in: high G+C Gram-positive bacteria)]|jgi:CrcB protein|uniref:fluoride efflux transporter FluC n=1 Tax=unclassified Rhodococcus (in: high G+C Gram-positive bacteria) TaxID=192944 RepID=UPI00146C3F5C|nr:MULTISPECIES: CrcB family protein [unclassified Rhodococcus (in: high G+C Gram-positive bacteria)]MBF0662545.1 CrcB family protein [Rhodococcus sp. (in: high G+C Gram-positive bacteria)]NME79323.1 CrcB family protein [Rhodococcus sp. 105337]